MPIKQSQEKLNEIERVTLGHYNSSAESFWLSTKDHDVSQSINAFLSALNETEYKNIDGSERVDSDGESPDIESSDIESAFDILDFGCGPGRDLMTFKHKGHRPTGLDGSSAFCEMARQHSGCPVLHQQFSQLELQSASFDGIFANASMFHIPSQELHRVLTQCHQAMRKKGILFISNPRGTTEGWQGDRYGHYMELEESQVSLEQAGFSVIDHYYRPEGKPRNRQPWLAIIARRIS